jgi:hypothetical protein
MQVYSNKNETYNLRLVKFHLPEGLQEKNHSFPQVTVGNFEQAKSSLPS